MTVEEVWQLKIPIRLSLSGSEITSPVEVKPVYLLAARHAYLPALAQQSLSFFQHVLLSVPGQSTPTPWFEYQGLPLNWTQPLGVLHDLISPAAAPTAAEAAEAQTAGQPPGSAAGSSCFGAPGNPWCLTVHYQNMPASLINSWQNAGAAKDHYFSSLKEAGYCCRGSDGSGAVMRLPGAAQDDLWSAVNRGDGAAVQAVMGQLRMQPTQKPGGGTCSVPVRIYIRKHAQGSGESEGLLGLWANTYSSSRPIDVTQPDGSATLLAHVLNIVMPQQFPAPQPPAAEAAEAVTAATSSKQSGPEQHHEHPSSSAPRDGGVADAIKDPAIHGSAPNDPLGAAITAASDVTGAAAVATARSQPEVPLCGGAIAASDSAALKAAVDPSPQQTASVATPEVQAAVSAAAEGHVLPRSGPVAGVRVFVCGVQPDWCTPLGWLHRNLRAADGFLYIVVHLLDTS